MNQEDKERLEEIIWWERFREGGLDYANNQKQER